MKTKKEVSSDQFFVVTQNEMWKTLAKSTVCKNKCECVVVF